MQSDHRAFLAAIAAEPDNDFPRLSFADWLDEKGDASDRARADLIRVQCEMESDEIDGRRFNQLKRRQDELLFEHWNEWSRELRALGLDSGGIAFRRGFVEHAEITPDQFIHNAQAILEAAPQLRSLTLRLGFNEAKRQPYEPVLPPKFFAIAELGRIHELTAGVVLDLNDADARSIADSPHLAQLTVLHLPSNAIGNEGMEAIARGRFAQSLRHLTIPANRITSLGFERFSAAAFPELRVLDISNNRITDSAIAALATSYGFRSLESLDVSGNPVGNDAALALLESDRLPKLERLCLPLWNLRDEIRARLVKRFQLMKPMDREDR